MILTRIGEIYASQLPAIIGLAVLFTALVIFEGQASSPGKVWWRNPGLVTDICYALINSVLAPYLRIPIFLLIFFIISGTLSKTAIEDYFNNGRGLLHGLSFWWQAAIYLLLTDFFLYWIHRSFHFTSLWKYHAIHHSAEQVEWTTSYRIHPVNMMLQQSLVAVLMIMLGISPEVMAFFIPWDVFSAAFVHANVKWSFGPLKYVIATPVFHRWHHCLPGDGGDKNFAPTFAFYDVLFGTFYMPEGRLPQAFGVDEREFPQDYLRQLAYPFRTLQTRLTHNAAETGRSPASTAN
ncbi:MAG TPA: sterol desaturase family protein [Hyphomicrobiales bacterium]|nr:sterol desaturase family protein [Hyphomicrobiales bacterium]